MRRFWIVLACALIATAAGVRAQETPAEQNQPPEPQESPAAAPAEPAAPPAEAPAGTAQAETQEAQAPAAEAAPAEPEAAPPAAPRAATGALNLQNASLVQVIDALCRQLRINYILDPRIKGGVILNTYGETANIDTRSLLDLILRINGAAMVQVGEIYRIVPLADAPRLPIPPQVNPDDIPADDQIMLNLVFLKYVTVTEVSKLLEPFVGEGAATWAYPPANLLLLLDSRRNMRRTMELIGMFDSDTLTNQRVRILETEHGRPSQLADELEQILQSISLSEEASPIRFLPVDRLNLIIAVAPNPGAFEEVERWLDKLDQPVKVTAGTVDNYVYRVKYRRAEGLAMAIMSLYYGGPMGLGGIGMGMGMEGGLFSGAAAGFGNRYRNSYGGLGGYGGGGYGGYGGGGYGGYGGGGYGGYGGGGYGGYGGGYGGYGGGYGGYGGGYGGYGGGYGGFRSYGSTTASGLPLASAMGSQQEGGAGDQTGSYLGAGGAPGEMGMGGPRVIPNYFDNTLLIQGTPQQYRQIVDLLETLDTPPRQVLIDARIYEVTLTGAFAAGVSAFLQKRGSGEVSLDTQKLTGSAGSDGINLSIGTLVGQSRELLSFLEAKATTSFAKVISAPSIIATDSIPASINVGQEVPTLTAQALPVQGGNSLINSVQNRTSGVTLSILARVTPSGIVTLIIDQEVSTPVPPAPGGIQSPSFAQRTVQTQITLNDGDTIAIGGIISESNTESSGGVPYLHRIPILGYAFGSKSKSEERTELVIFMTPRVIYDTTQLVDATEEIKSRFRKLNRVLRDQ